MKKRLIALLLISAMLITIVPICMARDRDDRGHGDRDFSSFHDRDLWQPPSWVFGNGYSYYDMYPSNYWWYNSYYPYRYWYYPYYSYSYYWNPYRY